MNERVLELVRQVWPDPSISHENHLKFAELLIRECARSVDRVYETAPPDHGCYDWATFPDGDDVLKHFGIEK